MPDSFYPLNPLIKMQSMMAVRGPESCPCCKNFHYHNRQSIERMKEWADMQLATWWDGPKQILKKGGECNCDAKPGQEHDSFCASQNRCKESQADRLTKGKDEFCTVAEVNRKIKIALDICKKRGEMDYTADQILFADKKQAYARWSALLDYLALPNLGHRGEHWTHEQLKDLLAHLRSL